jgi:hypothetical protein
MQALTRINLMKSTFAVLLSRTIVVACCAVAAGIVQAAPSFKLGATLNYFGNAVNVNRVDGLDLSDSGATLSAGYRNNGTVSLLLISNEGQTWKEWAFPAGTVSVVSGAINAQLQVVGTAITTGNIRRAFRVVGNQIQWMEHDAWLSTLDSSGNARGFQGNAAFLMLNNGGVVTDNSIGATTVQQLKLASGSGAAGLSVGEVWPTTGSNSEVAVFGSSLGSIGRPLGSVNARGHGISSDGLAIAGASVDGSGTERGFVWTSASGFTGLAATFQGKSATMTRAAGSLLPRFVAGTATLSGQNRGVVWLDGAGYDLNKTMESYTGVTITEVNKVNAKGQALVHYVWPNGQRFAGVTTPVRKARVTLALEDFREEMHNVNIGFSVRRADTGAVLFESAPTRYASNPFEFAMTESMPIEITVTALGWLSKTVSVPALDLWGSADLTVSLPNGDINTDNSVDILDYLLLSENFDTPGSPPWINPNPDVDCDGVVSILDYLVLSKNFGQVGD